MLQMQHRIQDFPGEGWTNPKGVYQPIILEILSRKLHEIKKKKDREGARIPSGLLGSANALDLPLPNIDA